MSGGDQQLRGLKAAAIGSLVLVALLGMLQLAVDWFSFLQDADRACSADGKGPFEDTLFEWLLPLLSMLWLGSIVAEVAMPRTWRHQDLASVFARAITSLTIWAVIATFVFVLSTICG